MNICLLQRIKAKEDSAMYECDAIVPENYQLILDVQTANTSFIANELIAKTLPFYQPRESLSGSIGS